MTGVNRIKMKKHLSTAIQNFQQNNCQPEEQRQSIELINSFILTGYGIEQFADRVYHHILKQNFRGRLAILKKRLA